MEESMYCRKCGKAVGDDDKFCFNCGDPLQKEDEQAGKSMQQKQVIEETPVSIANEETPTPIVDGEALVDDSLLEENNKEEITETEDVPEDFNPDDFTKVVKKKFCKKCDKERMLFGEKCWWCGSELETIEHTMKLTPNEMSHKKEEIERKKRIAEQNKRKEEEKRNSQVTIVKDTSNSNTSVGKIERNKGVIIFSVIGFLVLILLWVGYSAGDNTITPEQQKEISLIDTKRNFIDKVYKIHKTIISTSIKYEDDDSNQLEIFRKNAYGNLNEALDAYSESDKVVRSRRDNKNSLDNIDEDMNKYIYTIPPILEKDKEVNEMAELLKEEHEALKEYSEFVTNPYGTYSSYSNGSHECNTKLVSLLKKTNTRVNYISDRFIKEHPIKDDNSGKE